MDSSIPGAASREGASLQEHARRSTETAQQQAPPQQGISQQPENQQSSKDTQPDGSPKEHDSIKSWAAIEGEMKKEDEATMKGHMEDVDYLLVFAGLFSAVLTAFVVESYQQLQPDNQETSSKLLRRISIQLESFTLTPSFANSTHPVPALPSLDFTADAIARWINILWFLSLIFSLAAALFGILVKQWIREYMKWNSALAHPRDNVLVRQIRFEAWNDWNVPTTIAAVPALLEIALVMFVCGLVILLWTLDPVVSIVITTTAAVFLAIASTFTVLPAFFRRCPYKSPTAWAFAVSWDFLTRYIPHRLCTLQFQLGYWFWRWGCRRWGEWMMNFGSWLVDTSGLASSHPRIGNWIAFTHDWRSQDLANLWSSLWPGTKRGDAIPLLEELRLEREGSPTDFDPRLYSSTLPAVFHNAQRTITELSPLVRALAWVSQASQDAQTQVHVLSCVESLEARFTLPHDLSTDENFTSKFFDEDGVRAVSCWHLALDMLRRNARSVGKKPVAEERRNMGTLLAKFEPAKEPQEVGWMGVRLDCNSPEVSDFAHLLALSVRTLSRTLSDSPVSSDAFNHFRPRNVLRLRQYLAVLRYLYYRCDCSMPNMGDHLYDTFVETVIQESRSQMTLFPDWQPSMLSTIYAHNSPKLKKLMDELELYYYWDSVLGNLSKITEALSSGRRSTSHSQSVRPHATIQYSRKANLWADEPTGDAPQTPPTNPTLRSASFRQRRRSASSLPVAVTLPQNSSHRHSEASEGGRSSPSFVLLAEDEQDTLNDVAGISSSGLGSREPASSAVVSLHSHAPPGVEPQLDPSLSRTAGPSSPSSPHGLPSDSMPAEEEQGVTNDSAPTAQSPSRPKSSMRPADDAAGGTPELQSTNPTIERASSLNTLSHTAWPTPPLLSSDPPIASNDSHNQQGSAFCGSCVYNAGESGDHLYEQPEDEESPTYSILVDEEQKIASKPAPSSPFGSPSSSNSGGDDRVRLPDPAARSPLGSLPDDIELDPARPPRPSSYNAGPAPLHSVPTASTASPPRRDGVFDDTEPGSAGEGGSRLGDWEDGLPASEEGHVATTDIAREEV